MQNFIVNDKCYRNFIFQYIIGIQLGRLCNIPTKYTALSELVHFDKSIVIKNSINFLTC